MKIQKRDGRVVPYEEDKIREAIHKANNEVEERYRASEGLIEEILEDVQQEGRQTQTVEHIQDMIEEHLVEHNKYTLAKKYIVYRYQRSLLRKSNTTDESILKLIRNENKELAEENSNKNTRLASTQRDYIAGEVSRDVTRRLLLPEHIAMAHDNGVLHFHDADYFIQPIFNCCLINIGDMLENGTVMNGKLIESPKSFQVACTVMTQIISAVASSQYGGQSVDIRHLGRYLRKTRDKYERHYKEKYGDIISDEASQITGSIGMLSSASLNKTKLGLYEPSHGSAPDIAGKNIANPIATILSAAMMLRYSLDLDKEADAIEAAVAQVLKENYRTVDIMSEGMTQCTTTQMGDLIANHLA